MIGFSWFSGGKVISSSKSWKTALGFIILCICVAACSIKDAIWLSGAESFE